MIWANLLVKKEKFLLLCVLFASAIFSIIHDHDTTSKCLFWENWEKFFFSWNFPPFFAFRMGRKFDFQLIRFFSLCFVLFSGVLCCLSLIDCLVKEFLLWKLILRTKLLSRAFYENSFKVLWIQPKIEIEINIDLARKSTENEQSKQIFDFSVINFFRHFNKKFLGIFRCKEFIFLDEKIQFWNSLILKKSSNYYINIAFWSIFLLWYVIGKIVMKFAIHFSFKLWQ